MVETREGTTFIRNLPDGEWKITLADGEPGYVVLVDQTGKHAPLVVRMGEPNPYRKIGPYRGHPRDHGPRRGGYEVKRMPYGMVARPSVQTPLHGEVLDPEKSLVEICDEALALLSQDEEQSGYKPSVERHDD